MQDTDFNVWREISVLLLIKFKYLLKYLEYKYFLTEF